MNKLLLHKDVQDFIDSNLKNDLTKLILKGSPFKGISIQEIAEQIQSKLKSKNKLPLWFSTKGIYFPKPLSIEQTSSEITAAYKSDLVSGRILIDITGGFGIDSYYFTKTMDKVIHCEKERELSQIAAHNFDLMGLKKINCKNEDGITYLTNSTLDYDWIYADPSRRNTEKNKVFRLEDCVPDVLQHFDTLLARSSKVMLKLSPFLDIKGTVNSLKFIKEIHIVAVKNEVKELIFIIDKSSKNPIVLKAINIHKDGQDLFKGHFPSEAVAEYSLPKKYLYEPNSAILKSGLFNEVSHALKTHKLHTNSHLYTSDELIDFPGRRFQVLSVHRYNKKQIKRVFDFKKANITTRNFNETVAQIRKKTGLKEGGEQYLFFTTDIDNKAIVIHCQKV